MFCMDRRGLRACPIPHLHIERCSSIHKTGTVPSGFFTALPVWKAAQVVTKITAWSIVPISWSAAMAARHVCLFAVLAVVTYILVACPYILGTTVHGLQIKLVCWCLCFDQHIFQSSMGGRRNLFLNNDMAEGPRDMNPLICLQGSLRMARARS